MAQTSLRLTYFMSIGEPRVIKKVSPYQLTCALPTVASFNLLLTTGPQIHTARVFYIPRTRRRALQKYKLERHTATSKLSCASNLICNQKRVFLCGTKRQSKGCHRTFKESGLTKTLLRPEHTQLNNARFIAAVLKKTIPQNLLSSWTYLLWKALKYTAQY